jgi:uncharacterized protein YdeI (YjbR/CyaY-like superfamily)
MARNNPQVDAYIDKSAPFAQPILTRLREIVHASCPEVEEAIKWRAPFFVYRGILCFMSAFKHHCSFGFWNPAMREALEAAGMRAKGMSHLGRLTTVKDLPSKAELTRLIKQAMKLNESGAKPQRKPPAKKRPPVKVPPDFVAALAKNKKAHRTFTAFSPSHQREYVEWITDAKRDQTRQKRLATAIEWLAEGKSRNWKYERC